MLTLLKKDWRLYRVAIGGLLLVLVPYVLLVGVLLFDGIKNEFPSRGQVLDTLYHVANVALTMTGLTAAIFGGMAFAQERRERWAEYLAVLPVHRYQIVISKFLLSFGFLGILWSINAVVVLAAAGTYAESPGAQTTDVLLIVLSATAAMMAFGVAWLASTFLTSPAIAVGIAAVATIACLGWPSFFPAETEKMGDVQLASVLILCTLAMGAACLVEGTIHFIRRIEP